MENFESKLLAGNANGTGFIKFPKTTSLELKQPIRVEILSAEEPIFFAKVVESRGGKGFYIPKKIANTLIEEKGNHSFRVEGIAGFCSTISDDGRINVPADVIESEKVSDGDAVIISSGSSRKYCKVSLRERKNKREYGCQFYVEFAGQTKNFGLEKLRKAEPRNEFIRALAGEIELYSDGPLIVAMHGQKRPVLVSPETSEDEIAHYLGAYFADGTKIGNNWGICASTPEQAEYYIRCHKRIILNPDLDFYVSYTLLGEEKNLNERLEKVWGPVAKVFKVRAREATGKGRSYKLNDAGTLVVKELKKLTQIIYNKMVDQLVRQIRRENDSELAQNFILGVLEGDGNVSAGGHAHLIISSNGRDILLLDEVLKYSKLKYKVYKETGNRWFVRIGAISLLEHLGEIGDKIFAFYPKRRKKFIERFLNIGVARYLLGKQRNTTGWVKSKLRNEGFLDSSYMPTQKGEKLIACLKKMENELKELNKNGKGSSF